MFRSLSKKRYFGESDLTCTLRILRLSGRYSGSRYYCIQFVASDDNKYSVATYERLATSDVEGAYRLSEIHLYLLETYVGHFQMLNLYPFNAAIWM